MFNGFREFASVHFKIKSRNFYISQSCEQWRVARRGLTVYRSYPRGLESLTIFRCNYIGSTLYSVIWRPWVLVRPRFEPLISRTVVRHSANWANQTIWTNHFQRNLPWMPISRITRVITSRWSREAHHWTANSELSMWSFVVHGSLAVQHVIVSNSRLVTGAVNAMQTPT